MWNVKSKIIPVIMRATGTLSKSLRQYLSNIPGKHDIKELQKTAILATAHVLGKILMRKCENLTWEITLHVAQTVNTEQLQHCVPQEQLQHCVPQEQLQHCVPQEQLQHCVP
jgi:hypothetical protein